MYKTADDYESAYNPRIAVPEFAQHFERWTKNAEQARTGLQGHQDVAYGTHPMEKLDIFRAKGESRALLVYIHGGYWRALDKGVQSFVAVPFVERGVTTALINYALCPTVRVQDIVLQVLQSLAWLYRNGSNFGAPPDRLFVCGHSAGGHLTAMALAALWPKFAADLPNKVVQAGFSISGIYDVEPVMQTPSVNVDVRFDAGRSSPRESCVDATRDRRAALHRRRWQRAIRLPGAKPLDPRALEESGQGRHRVPGRQPLHHPGPLLQPRQRFVQGGDADDGAVEQVKGEESR